MKFTFVGIYLSIKNLFLTTKKSLRYYNVGVASIGCGVAVKLF